VGVRVGCLVPELLEEPGNEVLEGSTDAGLTSKGDTEARGKEGAEQGRSGHGMGDSEGEEGQGRRASRGRRGAR
jgi:hypothetical protein